MRELGKIQPQAIELEEALLGCYLLNNETVYDTMDNIKPSYFYKEHNGIICEAIFAMKRDSKPVDLMTLAAYMREKGNLEKIGGPSYLMKLTNNVDTTTSAEYYSKIVAQKYIKRQLIHVAYEIEKKAFDEDDDMMDILSFAERSIFGVSEQLSGDEPKLLEESLPETYEILKEAQERALRGEFIGIPTGLKTADELTGGWQPTDLIILGARPAMGKTALALFHALTAAKFDFPTLIFSLEMNIDQLNTRYISGETGYSSTDLRAGRFQDLECVRDAVGVLSPNKILVDDTGGIKIMELVSKARRMKKKHGIKFIVIDYLQLITVGKEFTSRSREQEVSTVVRTLKGLAKELKVPILALSQLNREVEKRPNKRPGLADLRESGAIEQDADIIFFAHRPAYYGEETMLVNNGKEMIEVNSERVGMEIFAKNRHGGLDDVFFEHNDAMTRIEVINFKQ